MQPAQVGYIRWLIRRDMPEILAIENQSFDDPWTEDQWLACIRERNHIGMVAERNGVIVGYMAYALESRKLVLLNLAVRTEFRRSGVGMSMIQKLRSKLHPQRRRMLVANVAETNLQAQLFMRACGLTAVRIEKEFFMCSDLTFQDAYRFVCVASLEDEESDGQCY